MDGEWESIPDSEQEDELKNGNGCTYEVSGAEKIRSKYCICESWDWKTKEDPRLGNLQTGPICEQSLRFRRRASVDVESVSEDDNRFSTCQVGGDRSPTEPQ
jgi:hypothetical protein